MFYILGLGIFFATLIFVLVHFTDADRTFDRYNGVPTLILMYVLVTAPVILIWYFELPRIETDLSQQIETANKRESSLEQSLTSAKEQVETAKQETETAKQKAETAKQRAETAKQQAETAKQDVERANRAAESAMQEAEHARKEAETRLEKAIAAEAEAAAKTQEAETRVQMVKGAEAQLAEETRLADAKMKEAEDRLVQTMRMREEAEARIKAAADIEKKANADKQEAARLLGEANQENADAEADLKRARDQKQEADKLLGDAEQKAAEADDKLKKAQDEKTAADKLIADANTKMAEADSELNNTRTKMERADKLVADATAKMTEADAKMSQADARARKAAEDEAAAQVAQQNVAASKQEADARLQKAKDAEAQLAAKTRQADVAIKEKEEVDRVTADPQVVQLFYATNRVPKTDGERPDYSGERADHLSYGAAYVRVPENHVHGAEPERPLHLEIFHACFQQCQDKSKYFVIRDVTVTSENEFYDAVSNFGDVNAIIFVHGFSNSFDDALYRFAQIIYDGNLQSMLPILFSWPSKGETGIAAYRYDESSSKLSTKVLVQLISTLRAKANIKTLDIVAHSMGNRIVLDALSELAKGDKANPMGEVTFAAPDVDDDVFRDEAPQAISLFKGATLYASKNDRAISFSGVEADHPRAGDVPPDGPIVLDGMDTIDVSAVGKDMFGLNHGTYSGTNVIDDLSRLLKFETRPPSERTSRIHPVPSLPGKPKYWKFVE